MPVPAKKQRILTPFGTCHNELFQTEQSGAYPYLIRQLTLCLGSVKVQTVLFYTPLEGVPVDAHDAGSLGDVALNLLQRKLGEMPVHCLDKVPPLLVGIKHPEKLGTEE